MTLLAGLAQAAMDEMSVHQARLQIAAARERSAKLDLVQQLEEQRTEKEAALEVCSDDGQSFTPRNGLTAM